MTAVPERESKQLAIGAGLPGSCPGILCGHLHRMSAVRQMKATTCLFARAGAGS